MFLLYHAYVYLEFLILACTIYILAPTQFPKRLIVGKDRAAVPLLPYLLSFAAGAMIYVVVEELIPESQAGEHSNIGTIGVAAALLNCEAAAITGKGAGLSDAGLLHKIAVIDEARKKYQFDSKDVFRILCSVGGLDIAGLCGVCIGGAVYGVPVVLDGVISAVAALVAERLVPGVKDFLIASHKSREPAAALILQELGVHPVIDGSLALGEGTGAVLMFGLLDTVHAVYGNRTTFSDIRVEAYKRFTDV